MRGYNGCLCCTSSTRNWDSGPRSRLILSVPLLPSFGFEYRLNNFLASRRSSVKPIDTSRGMHTQRQRTSEEYRLRSCVSCGQISVLASLLKSVAFTNKVNVTAIPRGLRFIVEEGKYVQASVTVNRDIFEEYKIDNDGDEADTSFKVSFKELLDCLKFFCTDGHGRGGDTFAFASATTTAIQSNSNSSSLKLLYRSFGNPLQLLLDENGIVTDFQIMTEPFDDDLMEFDVGGATIACKLILASEQMSDLLAEFESNNPGTIRVGIIPDKEMTLSCDGIAGVMTASIPCDSEMVQLFESASELHVTYKFSVLRYSFRAMNMSQTMSIKIDSNGVLRLIFLMPTKSDSFVEFFCLPSSMDETDAPIG